LLSNCLACEIAAGRRAFAAFEDAAEKLLKKPSVSVVAAALAATSSVNSVTLVVPGPIAYECNANPDDAATRMTHGSVKPAVDTDHEPSEAVWVVARPPTQFNKI
jgi:hypothetical protein